MSAADASSATVLVGGRPAIRVGDTTDIKTAVVLYAVVGGVLCASWTFFFQYLNRHPDLADERVERGFFARERLRTFVGVVL